MSRKRALAIIATLVVSFSLFSAPLVQIVQEAKQNSTTIKQINLARSSGEISLTQKDLPKELGISVEGEATYYEDITSGGDPSVKLDPSFSIVLPNDGDTTITFDADKINVNLTDKEYWRANPSIGVSHTLTFGDTRDKVEDLGLSIDKVNIEFSYQKQILNFENSIYGKIIELLNLEKTLLNNEKDIYVAKTKVEDSKVLKDVSFESASFKSLELDLARKESAKNSTLQKIALAQSQYEQLTGHLWQGVESIGKASLKLPSLKGGDSTVILASLKLEKATEEFEKLKNKILGTNIYSDVPTLKIGGIGALDYSKNVDEELTYSLGTNATYLNKNFVSGAKLSLDIKDAITSNPTLVYGIGGEVGYAGKNFNTSGGVNLTIEDGNVTPRITVGGSWSKNMTTQSDLLTLQNSENQVTLANIDYQQALIDYQMKLNSLASEVLDYEVSLKQFEQVVEITKQNLETTKEAFELGLVTETDLNNALLEVELLKFDKDVLELNGLILENKIKELSL